MTTNTRVRKEVKTNDINPANPLLNLDLHLFRRRHLFSPRNTVYDFPSNLGCDLEVSLGAKNFE